MTPIDSAPPPRTRVLVETSRALPLVAVTVALRSGSARDPLDREGCARFTGRLMRRTAGGREPKDLDALIDTLGAALSVEASHSSLAFQGVVVSRSLPRFIDLLADALARPRFDGGEFERLRRECQSELVEVLDNDRSLAQRWFLRRLFAGDAFGRSVVGTQRTIARLTVDDVTDFHRSEVGASNVVVAFGGDVDADFGHELANRLVSSLPGGAPFVEVEPDPSPRRGRHLVLVDKPERTQTQILIGGLGTRSDDPDHTALLVANTIFGGTFGARLAREIRVERGWSYGAYSSLGVDRRRHAFSLWTFPKAEDAAPCVRHELEMLARWRDGGVTAAELEQAQRYLTRSHVFAADTATKRVGLALDEEIYGLPAEYYEKYPDRVRAVTLDEVNASIRSRIALDNLLVTVVGTAAAIAEPLRAAIPDLGSDEIVPFDEDA